MEYLEQLVREWYEHQGYFVREDIWVGLEAAQSRSRVDGKSG